MRKVVTQGSFLSQVADLHRADSGAVMTEYVLTLALVSIGAAVAIVPLSAILIDLYGFVVWCIDLPFPIS